MEELLQDFLIEAGDLLSSVENGLVDLEQAPDNKKLLDDIFRGFHTIKGGAGFLAATELVTLCHHTESLFDLLRTGKLRVTSGTMDVILDAATAVRSMFAEMEQNILPKPADASLLVRLEAVIEGEPISTASALTAAMVAPLSTAGEKPVAVEPNWTQLYGAITGAGVVKAPPVPQLRVEAEEKIIQQAIGRRKTDRPGNSAPAGRRDNEKNRDNTIRVDTVRLDQVLNLSGEIGLTKNRLTSLRSDILSDKRDKATLQALDQAVDQLDLLVSNLQNAVMKTRMQPVGRLFQKYPRIARDLARALGKEVELRLIGEETEIDKTMIEDISDPIIHLIRNAIDHGVESTEQRIAAGKSEMSLVCLEAYQDGDHIVIKVSDDGSGMQPELLRAKAVQKGLISQEAADTMDEKQSFNLIFLPGFSTKDVASDVSGRGVGMDVVRTNIRKLNGSIDIVSVSGKGSTFAISLPLTLAILPVLVVLLGEQPFAVPLSMVREILLIDINHVQEIGGRATMVVRGDAMPIYPLSNLMGWESQQIPEYGILMHSTGQTFILAVDRFLGREDAVIKSLEGFRPEGIAGVSTMATGEIVLIADMKELMAKRAATCAVPRSTFFSALPTAA
ncbi:chemotaxis protein CheA [Georgfuchsia toluolica]|nr:chemotaxis protein CheA [Georgfuchsia toluolica]